MVTSARFFLLQGPNSIGESCVSPRQLFDLVFESLHFLLQLLIAPLIYSTIRINQGYDVILMGTCKNNVDSPAAFRFPLAVDARADLRVLVTSSLIVRVERKEEGDRGGHTPSFMARSTWYLI